MAYFGKLLSDRSQRIFGDDSDTLKILKLLSTETTPLIPVLSEFSGCNGNISRCARPFKVAGNLFRFPNELPVEQETTPQFFLACSPVLPIVPRFSSTPDFISCPRNVPVLPFLLPLLPNLGAMIYYHFGYGYGGAIGHMIVSALIHCLIYNFTFKLMHGMGLLASGLILLVVLGFLFLGNRRGQRY